MPWSLDARIPVMLVEDPAALAAALAGGPPAALLSDRPLDAPAAIRESFDAALPHAAACACCGGRSPAATALDRLFQARVRSACPWFERVVALAGSPAARDQVLGALAGDAVTQARFRLQG